MARDQGDLTKHWPRDKVISLLKNYAGGADFTEPLLREVCRQAFRLLHRKRGAENVNKGTRDAQS